MSSSLDLLHLAGAAASRAGDYIRSASRQVGKSASASDWVSRATTTGPRRSTRTPELIAEVLGKGAPDRGWWAKSRARSCTGRVWSGSWIRWTAPPTSCTAIPSTRSRSPLPWTEFSRGRRRRRRHPRAGLRRGTRQGSLAGDTRLSVSSLTEPARALLGTGYPFKHLDLLERYLEQFRRILPATSESAGPGPRRSTSPTSRRDGSTGSGSSCWRPGT
jgi:hypothetical protein